MISSENCRQTLENEPSLKNLMHLFSSFGFQMSLSRVALCSTSTWRSKLIVSALENSEVILILERAKRRAVKSAFASRLRNAFENTKIET